MKAITLRDLSPELVNIIQQRAEEEGTSMHRAVISLLEEVTGIRGKRNRKKPVHHDLDALAGAWTRDEAEEFDETLAAQRTIGPDHP